jgi:hypothetical protein
VTGKGLRGDECGCSLEHFLSTPIRGTAFFQACGEKMRYQV